MITSEELLAISVKAADDKRGEDIMALDVRGISPLADYYVICQGRSEKQVVAITDEIVDEAYKAGVRVKRVEGKDNGKWVLVDLGEVIVHIFHGEERDFYNLEKLWSDAPLVDVSEWVI